MIFFYLFEKDRYINLKQLFNRIPDVGEPNLPESVFMGGNLSMHDPEAITYTGESGSGLSS